MDINVYNDKLWIYIVYVIWYVAMWWKFENCVNFIRYQIKVYYLIIDLLIFVVERHPMEHFSRYIEFIILASWTNLFLLNQNNDDWPKKNIPLWHLPKGGVLFFSPLPLFSFCLTLWYTAASAEAISFLDFGWALQPNRLRYLSSVKTLYSVYVWT